MNLEVLEKTDDKLVLIIEGVSVEMINAIRNGNTLTNILRQGRAQNALQNACAYQRHQEQS